LLLVWRQLQHLLLLLSLLLLLLQQDLLMMRPGLRYGHERRGSTPVSRSGNSAAQVWQLVCQAMCGRLLLLLLPRRLLLQPRRLLLLLLACAAGPVLVCLCGEQGGLAKAAAAAVAGACDVRVCCINVCRLGQLSLLVRVLVGRWRLLGAAAAALGAAVVAEAHGFEPPAEGHVGLAGVGDADAAGPHSMHGTGHTQEHSRAA
jgi:hypothetical protein